MNKINKIDFKTVLIALAMLCFTLNSWAQTAIPVDQLLSRNYQSINLPSGAAKSISINFNNTPILIALNQLAEASGLSLNYNSRRVESNVLISGNYQNVTVKEVIANVTKEAGLFYYITDSAQLLVSSHAIPSEYGSLRGTVIDAQSSEGLLAVNLLIVELQTGISTDVEGNFRLERITPGEYTLQITSIGYKQQLIPIVISADEELVLRIRLEADTSFLDEVVITGFSIRNRSLPTGSVNRIEGENFQNSLTQSPEQVLQGRTSGVQMQSIGGQPGSGMQVRIRGTGSINASNSPLYIIDGVRIRMSGTSDVLRGQDNPLATINPDDIENVEILKDASATALYGAQGANGVVLITTRQARRGQTRIDVSSQIGFTEQPRKLDIMDGPTWTETMIQGYVNTRVDAGTDPATARQMGVQIYGDPATAPTYDWQDALTRSGAMYKYNFAASTGMENTRIYLSASYDFEEGTVLASDFSRIQLRSNIDHQFNNRFTVVTRLSLASTESNGLIIGSANILSPFHGGYTQRPIDAIYDENGDYNHNDIIRVNLVHALNENTRQSRMRQVRGSVSGIYNIMDNLSIRSFWGLDFRNVRDQTYTSPNLPRYIDLGGVLYEGFAETISMNSNQVIEYATSFENHGITVLGGFEYINNSRGGFNAEGSQFPNESLRELNLAGSRDGIGGSSTTSKFAGIFSRTDYNYDSRYFVTGTLRYDGSSRFGEKNRWGTFYSGAFAWDIRRESFMDQLDMVDLLKLRTSYGVTGNSGISDFAARSLFGSGGTYEGQTGLRPSGLGNDLLTWEEAVSFDIGIEFSFLNERVYGDINRFRRLNRNLLLNAFLPTDSGFSSIARNVGKVENVGWEFELGARWISNRNLRWSTDFNITFVDNEIIELVDGLELLGSTTRLGYPLDIIWDNKFAGINPADGRAFWYDANGEITYRRTSADQQYIGNQSPDFFGGLINTFTYKNFMLRAFFQYEYGRMANNATIGNRMHSVSQERGLMARVATYAWMEPGDMTFIPRHYISTAFPGSSAHYHSSLYYADASYIRLKEITLTYSVPRSILERTGLNRASIILQGRNVLTWTNYPFGDPEFYFSGTGEYPVPRQFTVGVNLQF